MDKRFLATVSIIIAIFVGILWLSSSKTTNDQTASSSAQPTSHLKGNKNSSIKFVEYGDFQCPACYGYEPVVQQIREKYKDQITLQFIHFPLVQIHPNAMAAHRAAEAAHKQGKFWEFHDLLYQNQEQWSKLSSLTPIFEGYAQQLGLNVAQFKTDTASSGVNAIIQADIKKGQKIGVNSTPTFLLNGKKIQATSLEASFEEFSKLIDEALKKQ